MREDGGRDAADDEESQVARSDGSTSDAHWDETLAGGTADADADADGDDAEDGGDDEDSSGNVAGEFRPSGPIEPGTPDVENALFVIAGAYVAVLGLTRLFVDQSGFDGQDILVLTGGTLLVGFILMGFFGVLTPDT